AREGRAQPARPRSGRAARRSRAKRGPPRRMEGERRSARSIAGSSRSTPMSTFGIAVGGGPAPGINGVIGAAATRARRRGQRVIGIYDGFSRIMEGDTSRVVELEVDAVARIHLP